MPLSPPRRFSTPKAGNRADECEDDSRVVYPASKYGLNSARIALSDGASESAFAKSWAQILTEAFARKPFDLSNPTQCALESWLAPSQEEWDKKVPWDRIPWHGEAKARAGALATLLALSIEPSRSGRPSWQAVAVGDSCLFVVRDKELMLSFPLEDPAQFNNTPALICSNPANNRGPRRTGPPEPGRIRGGRPVHPGLRRPGLLDTGACRSRGKAMGNALGGGLAGELGRLGADAKA